MASKRRPYKLIDDMVSVGAQRMVEQLGLAQESAEELMTQIAHDVCFLNAKQLIYVPEALDIKLSKRDESIWDEYQKDGPDGARKFTVARAEQLAAQHSLSLTQIYNIVRVMRRRDLVDRQTLLPGLEPA